AGGFGVDPAAWFHAITARMDRMLALEEKLSMSLTREAEEVVTAAREQLAMYVVIGAGAALAAVLLALWLARSISSPLRSAGSSALDVSVRMVSSVREQSATAAETAAIVAQVALTTDAIGEAAELSVRSTKAVMEAAQRGASAGEHGMSAMA